MVTLLRTGNEGSPAPGASCYPTRPQDDAPGVRIFCRSSAMPAKKTSKRPTTSKRVVVDENGKEYVLHGFGWGKDFPLDLDSTHRPDQAHLGTGSASGRAGCISRLSYFGACRERLAKSTKVGQLGFGVWPSVCWRKPMSPEMTAVATGGSVVVPSPFLPSSS